MIGHQLIVPKGKLIEVQGNDIRNLQSELCRICELGLSVLGPDIDKRTLALCFPVVSLSISDLSTEEI